MEEDCRSANDLKGALYYSNLRMKQVKLGTHEYAIVAYYRAVICKQLNKDEDAIYYLLVSALCDVRTAVMDQGSMWELANLLNQNKRSLPIPILTSSLHGMQPAFQYRSSKSPNHAVALCR